MEFEDSNFSRIQTRVKLDKNKKRTKKRVINLENPYKIIKFVD